MSNQLSIVLLVSLFVASSLATCPTPLIYSFNHAACLEHGTGHTQLFMWQLYNNPPVGTVQSPNVTINDCQGIDTSDGSETGTCHVIAFAEQWSWIPGTQQLQLSQAHSCENTGFSNNALCTRFYVISFFFPGCGAVQTTVIVPSTDTAINGDTADCKVLPPTTTGVTSHSVTTGVTSALVTTGVTSALITTGVTSGKITTGITSKDLSTGVTSALVTTGITSKDLSTGVTSADLSTGITSMDITTGITTAVCNTVINDFRWIRVTAITKTGHSILFTWTTLQNGGVTSYVIRASHYPFSNENLYCDSRSANGPGDYEFKTSCFNNNKVYFQIEYQTACAPGTTFQSNVIQMTLEK